jgi:hypothetical protein
MGFSSEQTAGIATPEGRAAAPASPAPTSAPASPSFGQMLQSRYPVAGGLANMVFGGGQPAQPGQAAAPTASMPTGQEGQPAQGDLIAMNAQPPKGGGLEAVLKLIMGGG